MPNATVRANNEVVLIEAGSRSATLALTLREVLLNIKIEIHVNQNRNYYRFKT